MGNVRWSSVIRSVRRRPLESFNRTWLGFVALTVVATLVAASLIVKALGLGYTRYTAEFLQESRMRICDVLRAAAHARVSPRQRRIAGASRRSRSRLAPARPAMAPANKRVTT